MCNHTKWLGIAALSLAAGVANAAERGQFRVTPYIGHSQVGVDGRHREFGESERYDGLAVGIAVGYRTSFGLIMEIGTSAAGDPVFGWARGGELRERYVAAGYDLEFAGHWHFIPRIGLTKWTLKDGAFDDLFDDAGEPRDSLDGENAFVEVALDRWFTEHVSAGLSFRAADVDFGSATSVALTFTWSF